jgi:hypothetical protein
MSAPVEWSIWHVNIDRQQVCGHIDRKNGRTHVAKHYLNPLELWDSLNPDCRVHRRAFGRAASGQQRYDALSSALVSYEDLVRKVTEGPHSLVDARWIACPVGKGGRLGVVAQVGLFCAFNRRAHAPHNLCTAFWPNPSRYKRPAERKQAALRKLAEAVRASARAR